LGEAFWSHFGWVLYCSLLLSRLVISLFLAEPDMLRFPISLLTVSALISGIAISLFNHYQAEAELAMWWEQRRSQATDHTCTCTCNFSIVNWVAHDARSEEARKAYVRRAVRAAEGAIKDMMDLVGIDEVSGVCFVAREDCG
jgi:hypothetical protein